MKHITKVRELYEETIHWISESEDSWKNFLSCMGRLYQLDFLNTCMVYIKAIAVKRILSQISQEFPDVGFETTEQRRAEIENYKMLVRILCVLIGGVLGVIGVVNLINIIFTNLIVRNRELATFRSIGATRKQLRELIMRESVGYVFYAAIGGFIFATFISITVVKAICFSNWFLAFRFTLLPAITVIILYLIISIIASEVGIYLWEKKVLQTVLGICR